MEFWVTNKYNKIIIKSNQKHMCIEQNELTQYLDPIIVEKAGSLMPSEKPA